MYANVYVAEKEEKPANPWTDFNELVVKRETQILLLKRQEDSWHGFDRPGQLKQGINNFVRIKTSLVFHASKMLSEDDNVVQKLTEWYNGSVPIQP